MDMRRRTRGLTLVEVAIVLVITGLLVGGLLQGREMVNRAHVARVERDYAAVAGAVLAYRERYGALPGDDPAATTRFPGILDAGDDGDGDGSIQGPWNSTNGAHESRLAWKHLRAAGLLKGPGDGAGDGPPTHALGGPIGLGQGLHNLRGPVVVFGGLPGDVDRLLESRVDDGNPAAGTIQGHVTAARYDAAAAYDVAFRF